MFCLNERELRVCVLLRFMMLCQIVSWDLMEKTIGNRPEICLITLPAILLDQPSREKTPEAFWKCIGLDIPLNFFGGGGGGGGGLGTTFSWPAPAK